MPSKRLKAFLDENSVKYLSIRHSEAYTAQEVAESAHVSGKDIAKTVVVKVDGQMMLCVLPATKSISFDKLQNFTGAEHVVLATEEEFRELFPECEVGAMSPFGNLYGLQVFVDESTHKDHEIVFNAGTHTEVIQMRYSDFARLVEPRVGPFTV